MKIPQWPLAERPREKLLAHGAQILTNSELLALLLGFGTVGKNAHDLARELLFQFGSLKKLQMAEPQELCRIKGLGKAKYARLSAALELGKRFSEEALQIGEKLSSSQLAQRFLETRLREQEREVFACLFLNRQNRILAFEELAQGSLAEATVYPREVVKRALAHNAAKLIVSHNHPSGNPEPSEADRETTRRLRQALDLVEIEVVDHIIIGRAANFSFAEAGWI